MSFRLKAGRPIGRELQRVIDHQLAGAIARLQTEPSPGREGLHEARKHVKKARSAIKLARPWLGNAFIAAKRRLRIANGRLGPYADAWAVLDTLERFQGLNPSTPRATIAAVRSYLVDRAARLERQIDTTRVRDRLVRLLNAERAQIHTCKVKADRRSVIRGIGQAHRVAGVAMRTAFSHPNAEAYHKWRQRVKTEWYLVRLIVDRCGEPIAADERRLEALDGCLGELHNVSTLLDLISAESPLTRRDLAECLLALRAYRRGLRHQAHAMGRIYAERPSRLKARLRQAWDSPADATSGIVTGPWPRVA